MDRRSFAIQNVIISFATVTILLNSIQANLWFFKVAHVIYIFEAAEGQKASVLLLSKPCRMFQSALYTACSSYLTFPMSQWLKMLKVCTTWLVERPRWTERDAPVNHKHILRSNRAKGFSIPISVIIGGSQRLHQGSIYKWVAMHAAKAHWQSSLAGSIQKSMLHQREEVSLGQPCSEVHLICTWILKYSSTLDVG